VNSGSGIWITRSGNDVWAESEITKLCFSLSTLKMQLLPFIFMLSPQIGTVNKYGDLSATRLEYI